MKRRCRLFRTHFPVLLLNFHAAQMNQTVRNLIHAFKYKSTVIYMLCNEINFLILITYTLRVCCFNVDLYAFNC